MSGKAAAVEEVVIDVDDGGKKRKRKKLLIIGAIVFLLLALGGGGGAYYFLVFKKSAAKGAGGGDHGAAAESARAEEEAAHAKPPVFVALERFVVNLQSDSTDRYLAMEVELKVAAPEIAERVKQHVPEIRNDIVLILSGKKVEDVNTREGKERLRLEIRDAANAKIGVRKGAPPQGAESDQKTRSGVLDVLLTSFAIQ